MKVLPLEDVSKPRVILEGLLLSTRGEFVEQDIRRVWNVRDSKSLISGILDPYLSSIGKAMEKYQDWTVAYPPVDCTTFVRRLSRSGRIMQFMNLLKWSYDLRSRETPCVECIGCEARPLADSESMVGYFLIAKSHEVFDHFCSRESCKRYDGHNCIKEMETWVGISRFLRFNWVPSSDHTALEILLDSLFPGWDSQGSWFILERSFWT